MPLPFAKIFQFGKEGEFLSLSKAKALAKEKAALSRTTSIAREAGRTSKLRTAPKIEKFSPLHSTPLAKHVEVPVNRPRGEFSKGMGSTATVFGKTVGYAGTALVPLGAAVGSGFGLTKLYDYYKDVSAKTPDISQTDQRLDNYGRALDLAQREQDLRNAQFQENPGANDPYAQGNYPIFDSVGRTPLEGVKESPSSSGSPLWILGGILAVATGGYFLLKKKK